MAMAAISVSTEERIVRPLGAPEMINFGRMYEGGDPQWITHPGKSEEGFAESLGGWVSPKTLQDFLNDRATRDKADKLVWGGKMLGLC